MLGNWSGIWYTVALVWTMSWFLLGRSSSVVSRVQATRRPDPITHNADKLIQKRLTAGSVRGISTQTRRGPGAAQHRGLSLPHARQELHPGEHVRRQTRVRVGVLLRRGRVVDALVHR